MTEQLPASHPRIWLGRAGWTSLLACVVICLLLHVWNRCRQINADDLSFLFYAQDLFAGHRLTEWRWCNSPYWLPDVLLFLPLCFVTSNPLHAYFLHNVLLFVLQFVVSAALYARLAGRERAWLPFAALQLLTLLFLTHGQIISPHYKINWIGWHGGAIIVGVPFLLLTIDVAHSAIIPRWRLFALLSLAFWSTLSDRTFLAQFAIPVAACLVYQSASKQISLRRALLLLFLLTADCILAAFSQTALTKLGWFHTPSLPSATWRARLEGLLRLPDVLLGMCQSVPFSVLLVVVVLALCVQRLRHDWHTRSTQSPEREWGWLAVFFPLCLAGSFLSPIYIGLLINFDHTRFYHPVLIPGSVLLLAWLMHSFQAASFRRLSVLGAACVAFALLATAREVHSIYLRTRTERLDIATWPQAQSLALALSQHDLRCGYTGFWESKILTLAYPKHRATQLVPGGGFFPWLTNLDYYFTDDPELGRGIPRYDYLFLSRRDPISLGGHPFWERFGPPAAVVERDVDRILIYNRPSDVGFRNFLRLPFLIETRRPMPSSATRAELRRYKPSGTPSTFDSVPMRLNESQRFALEEPMPVAGRVLELGLDWNDEYEISFLHQGVVVGTTRLRTVAPRLPPTLNPFFLLVEDFVQVETIDAVEVKAVAGDGNFAIGHLFVYPDSRVSPRERPPSDSGKSLAGARVP